MKEKNYTLTEKELFDLLQFEHQNAYWISLFCMRVLDGISKETMAELEYGAETERFIAQGMHEKLSPKVKQILSDHYERINKEANE